MAIIINVGYNSKHFGDFSINRPYGAGNYTLVITKTDGYIILSGKKQFLKANSIILFNKNTPQLYGSINNSYIDDWCHFDFSETDLAKIQDLCIPFDTVLQFANISDFSIIIRNMFYEKYSQNVCKEKTINLYFELLLLKLHEKIKYPDPNKENPYFSDLLKIRNDLFLYPQKDWNIEDISKKLNLSSSYIQHLYKSFFGNSIISEVTNNRIEYAKYLLSSTDMNVESIATSCGYKNSVHFMRLFKKNVQLTPSQYRTQKHVSSQEIANSVKEMPYKSSSDI